MSGQGLGLGNRVKYLFKRATRIDIGSLTTRARECAKQHGRSTFAVFFDMLWSAARHNVGFQDYADYDFAMLTKAERATYMTHPVSNELSQKYDAPEFRGQFQDKIEFNKAFDEFLGREWLALTAGNAAELRAFGERHSTLITKTPAGSAGLGVRRYYAKDISDWDGFHAELLERGELLVEEVIVQHEDLAAVCPGTVNTTRITTFFDGIDTHILAVAQKFGRGEVSDQMSFGGFYTMLDDDGHSVGAGYDSHNHVYENHPDSQFRIADFQLPLWDEVVTFIDRVARNRPRVQYVGWDVVVTPSGPVLVEGNWAAGVYENKPSVTGIRTGHKPRYRKAVGF